MSSLSVSSAPSRSHPGSETRSGTRPGLPGSPLFERLDALARLVEQPAQSWAERSMAVEGFRRRLPESYRHDCFTAAFEAFVAFGGEVERAAEFEWARHETGMVEHMLLGLRTQYVGSGSTLAALDGASRDRRSCAAVRELQWDAWQRNGVVDETDAAEMIIEAVFASELADLTTELREKLSPTDVAMLQRVYLDETPIIEIARENIARRGSAGELEDATPAQLAEMLNAERLRLSQQVSRARKRAQSRLARRWHTRAEEIR